jgi:hypothetical protein
MLHPSARNLLLATCMIAAPSLALAQSNAPRAPAQPNQQMQNTQSGAQTQPGAQVQSGAQSRQRQFLAAPQAGHIRAADLRSADIYTSDNQKVGDIDDILLDSRGNIVAVVVGVGGFLGIGQKNVAIPFESLDMRDPNMTASNTTGMGTANAPANRDRMTTGAVPGSGAMTDQDRQRNTAQRAEDMSQQQANRQQMNQTTTTTTTTAPAPRTAQAATGVWKPERIILQGVTKAELEAAPEFNWDGRARPARSGNAPNAPANNR